MLGTAGGSMIGACGGLAQGPAPFRYKLLGIGLFQRDRL